MAATRTRTLISSALLLLAGIAVLSVSAKITVEPDGGYTGIVFKISDDVPEESCADIIENLQVSLTFFLIWRENSKIQFSTDTLILSLCSDLSS